MALSGTGGRLTWLKEATEGTFIPPSATTGLRVFFQPPFGANRKQDPQRFAAEVTGTASAHRRDLPLGVLAIDGSFRFPCRYSGVHAVMAGWALGDLVTTGADPYTHTAKTADAFVAASMALHIPISAANPFSQASIAGCKPTRATWSQRVGEVMFCDIDYVGVSNVYSTTEGTIPPDDGKFSPGEPMVNWDRISGTIEFKRLGIALVSLNVVSYSISIENPVDQHALIGSSKLLSVPVRSDKTIITGQMEVEYDANYEDTVNAFGLTVAEATEDVRIKMTYADAIDPVINWIWELSNLRLTASPVGISTAGSLTQTFSFEGYHKLAGVDINPEPILLKIINHSEGPQVGTTYGSLV